jgi:hypothetical protein
MGDDPDLETWLSEAGAEVIQNQAAFAVTGLSPQERLIYCLWVADYGMRNAGGLETASDLYAPFQEEAVRLASEFGLPLTHEAFALPRERLEEQYFERFEDVCKEVRAVQRKRF